MILEGRLDTGMTAGEVVARASEWWNTFGRHHIPKSEVVPSGLLEGKAWDELSRDEQRQICKAWHHHFVRVPQEHAEVRLPTPVDQVLSIRCDSELHPQADRDEETVFRGRTQAQCFEQAKHRGWLISPAKDICPRCMGISFVDEPERTQ